MYLVHNKAGTGCFAEGSQIRHTHKNIEDIKVGDVVTAFDLTDGEWKQRQVTELQGGLKKRDYFVINETLIVSPNHWLWFNDRCVKPNEVEEGGYMYDADLNKIEIRSVRYVEETANRFNIILGKQDNLVYDVDGFLVYNSW